MILRYAVLREYVAAGVLYLCRCAPAFQYVSVGCHLVSPRNAKNACAAPLLNGDEVLQIRAIVAVLVRQELNRLQLVVDADFSLILRAADRSLIDHARNSSFQFCRLA